MVANLSRNQAGLIRTSNMRWVFQDDRDIIIFGRCATFCSLALSDCDRTIASPETPRLRLRQRTVKYVNISSNVRPSSTKLLYASLMQIRYQRRYCSSSWHDNLWSFPSHTFSFLMPCSRTFSTSPPLFPWPNVIWLLLSPKQRLKGIAPSPHLNCSFIPRQHPYNQPINPQRISWLKQHNHMSSCQLHTYGKPRTICFNCEARSHGHA